VATPFNRGSAAPEVIGHDGEAALDVAVVGLTAAGVAVSGTSTGDAAVAAAGAVAGMEATGAAGGTDDPATAGVGGKVPAEPAELVASADGPLVSG